MRTVNWNRIRQIFLDAADLPRDEQRRFIAEACGQDEALRLEVQSLLDADGKHGEAVARAVEGEAAALLESHTLAGQRLGPYYVVKEIGRGGIGAVYLAERNDPFRKQVAIKVVKRGMDSDDALGRFRAERQILAHLEHPYIARLIDGGATDDGRPFLVMEYVEGQPIDDYCAAHSLSLADRCRLFLKVCEAVSYAHRNLVIHRDLKPGNILIGGDGRPKLLDFGVAKILDPLLDHTTTMRLGAGRPLTPDYASPEQVRGTAGSTATDVYSLGAILHELLTGVRPHRITSADPDALERAICQAELQPPSAVLQGVDGKERLRRQLAGDLDHIVMQAMRKDPARRYISVDQFAEDIRRYLDSRPVRACPDSLWYRVSKFARRQRFALVAATAIAASLICGIVIALSQAREATRARRIAEIHRDAAIAEQRRAEQRLAEIVSLSNLSLSDVYARIEHLPGAMPARQELVGGTVEFLEKVSKEAGNNGPLRLALARAYLRLGELQGDPDAPNLGDTPGALRSFQAGSALLSPVAPLTARFPPLEAVERLELWADLQDKIGKVFTQTDRLAAETFRNAIAIVEASRAALPDASRIDAELHLSLSRATYDLPEALLVAQQALAQATAASRQAPGDSGVQILLSTANTQTGFVYTLMENPEAALPYYQAGMQIRESLALAHPGDLLYRRYLRLAYEHFAALQGGQDRPNLGHPEIARLYYKKAQPLEEADLADPRNRLAKFDYATFLLDRSKVEVAPGQAAETLSNLRQAAAMFAGLGEAEPGVTKYDRSTADAYGWTGRRLMETGRPSEALAQFEQALQLYNRLLLSTIVDDLTIRGAVTAECGMARTLAASGNRQAALRHAQNAVQRAESASRMARQGPRTEAYQALAEVHQKFGECAAAAAAARQSLKSITPLMGRSQKERIEREAESLASKCNGARP